MPIQLEIALFCLYGVRLGYLVSRWTQYGYVTPVSGFCSALLSIGSLIGVAEAALATLTKEQQISTGPFPRILLVFCTLPCAMWIVGVALAACTERVWPRPTVERQLWLASKSLLLKIVKRNKKVQTELL